MSKLEEVKKKLLEFSDSFEDSNASNKWENDAKLIYLEDVENLQNHRKNIEKINKDNFDKLMEAFKPVLKYNEELKALEERKVKALEKIASCVEIVDQNHAVFRSH